MTSPDPVRTLLGALADHARPTPGPGGPRPTWSSCGGAHLTGPPTSDGLEPRGDVVGVVHDLLGVLAEHGSGDLDLPDAAVIGERAAILGLRRQGSVSCGGAGRLLPTLDGTAVLSLARADDLATVPALVEDDVTDPWTSVTAWCAAHTSHEVDERFALLSLPGGAVRPPDPAGRAGVVATRGGDRRRRTRLRVLDLTSLWAGPLCGHLLGLAGADVVKVEDVSRPDGARRGDPRFLDLLHGGHRAVAVDHRRPRDRDVLRRLVAEADVVLESSRPRALAGWGLDATDAVTHGTTWVSITARGRDDPASRVGFGDDVAAAAGLVAGSAAEPFFCADAVADPLSGLLAAAACTVALTTDHAWLLDVSMHDTCRVTALAPPPPPGSGRPLPPRARAPLHRAPRIGEHTTQVEREWLR